MTSLPLLGAVALFLCSVVSVSADCKGGKKNVCEAEFAALKMCVAKAVKGGRGDCDKGLNLKVTDVYREPKGSGKMYLSVDFLADAEPEVEWSTLDPSTEEKIVLKGEMTYDKVEKAGKTMVEAETKYQAVSVSLGRLTAKGQHYLKASFDVRRNSASSHQLGYTLAVVTPSTDFAYQPADTATLTIQSSLKLGGGLERVSDDPAAMAGYDYNTTTVQPKPYMDDDPTELNGSYYNATSNKVVIIDGPYKYVKVSEKTTDDVKTVTYNFDVGSFALNGVFLKNSYLSVTKRNSPLAYMMEVMELVIHEASNSGPYPDDLLKAQFDNGPIKGCQPNGYLCYLMCRAHSNSLSTLEIFKEDRSGNREKLVNGFTRKDTPYMMSSSVNILGSKPFAGNYVCVATKEDGVTKGEDLIKVVSVDQRPWIRSLTGVNTGSGKEKMVTCRVTGTPPIDVTFHWQYNQEEIKIGENGVTDYQPAKIMEYPPGTQEVSATMKFVAQAGPAYLRCLAKNLASSEEKFYL